MTRRDQKNILLFITRTGMYIHVVDEENIISFINGYELGAKCDFSLKLSQYLVNNYKIAHRSDGWYGQISRLTKKLKTNWVCVFKSVSLEVLATEKPFTKEMKELLKLRIKTLLERSSQSTDDEWKEEWNSICSSSNNWFKEIWTKDEWETIQSRN